MSNTAKTNIRELRKLNFDLANYFTNTIIPQLFIDADMVLRIFTPPAMKLFSLSNDDINRDFHEVKDNIKYPTIIENIEEVIAKRKILEKEIETTDGKWFQMNILPYTDHENNKPNGVILTFVDITQRLASMKELENLNAKHDVLMFALSHDLKQPLTSMLLLLNGLKIAYKKKDEAQFETWIKNLKNSVDNIKSLLNDYAEESHTANEKPEQLQRLNIEQTCQNVIEGLKTEILKNNIHITYQIGASDIIFPKNNLRSIIYNLIYNAIKFRKPNTQLHIKITTTKMDKFVLLSVEDNGIGIEDKHHTTIFKKAARLNPSIDGTGMGLYILKRMVQSNGGKVELDSSPGKGSKFSVYFKDRISSKN